MVPLFRLSRLIQKSSAFFFVLLCIIAMGIFIHAGQTGNIDNVSFGILAMFMTVKLFVVWGIATIAKFCFNPHE